VSGGKQCSRGSHPYLGFNGHVEAAGQSCDGELLVFKVGTGAGLLRWASVQGEGGAASGGFSSTPRPGGRAWIASN
jgi:hypothetical protein